MIKIVTPTLPISILITLYFVIDGNGLPQNLYAEALTFTVTVFGDRTFKEEIKAK